MRKSIYLRLIILLLVPVSSYTQPTIYNCENFSTGTVLKFIKCNTAGVIAGQQGANQVWNFSSLNSLADTSTEWMVSPASTTHGNLFPLSNLVEKYSDGTFVYAICSSGNSQMTGYVDTVNNYTVHYTNPMIFAARPISFGNIFADTFSVSFSSPSINYTGLGVDSIYADAYGTLILPNGTFNNVLRVKITQFQLDTMTTGGSQFNSTTISFAWFDGVHTSALLKIDTTFSGTYTSKDIEYLFDETTGIENYNADPGFMIYPDPASEQLIISGVEKGILEITDISGKKIMELPVTDKRTIIPASNFPEGLYFISFQTSKFRKVQKLVISH